MQSVKCTLKKIVKNENVFTVPFPHSSIFGRSDRSGFEGNSAKETNYVMHISFKSQHSPVQHLVSGFVIAGPVLT